MQLTSDAVTLAYRAGNAAVRASGRTDLLPDASTIALLSAWQAVPEGADGPLAVKTIRADVTDWLRQTTHLRRKYQVEFVPLPRVREIHCRPIDPTPAIDVSRLLSALRPRERDIVTRHWLDGETHLEIARSQGVTEGRIAQIEHRAFERMREQLKGTS